MAAEKEPQAPTPPAQEPQGTQLSPWLRLMLAEIAAKREDLERARAEQLLRAREAGGDASDACEPGPGG